MSCKSFPVAQDTEDNPAIQLFGKRLFNDQTPIELLIEFLLVSTSSKCIGGQGAPFTTPLPTMNVITEWSGADDLQYSPKACKGRSKIVARGGAKT